MSGMDEVRPHLPCLRFGEWCAIFDALDALTKTAAQAPGFSYGVKPPKRRRKPLASAMGSSRRGPKAQRFRHVLPGEVVLPGQKTLLDVAWPTREAMKGASQ